jgi:hypothetical protein
MGLKIIFGGVTGGAEGVLAEKFRTFSALSTALGAEDAGVRAALWGPSDRCGWWRSLGGGDIIVDSPLDLHVLDGSELSGSDVVPIGAANAPTWATPGANGGMIMDYSGGVTLPFLGDLPSQMRSLHALAYPTFAAVATLQTIFLGTYRTIISDQCMMGGYRRNTLTHWYRATAIGPITAPVFGTGPSQEPLTSGSEVVIGMAALTTDSASNRGGYVMGGYAGDHSPSINTAPVGGSYSGLFTAAPLHRALLHVTGVSGEISVRFKRLFILAAEREGGVTP